jgi:hypothetical protein
VIGSQSGLHLWKNFIAGDQEGHQPHKQARWCVQAMVVLILPTLVRSDILAGSIPKAGVSIILSFSTLEHLLEWYNALTYKSEKVTLVEELPGI